MFDDEQVVYSSNTMIAKLQSECKITENSAKVTNGSSLRSDFNINNDNNKNDSTRQWPSEFLRSFFFPKENC